MKTKIFLLGLLASLLLAGFGCDDSIDSIGMGVLPDGDRIRARIDSFSITGKTVKADSVYAKTIYGMLGRFSDPDYGDISAGYMCQFVPPPTSVFTANDLDSLTFDSSFLQITYTTFTGDSLTPMEVTVYPLTKDLDTHAYAYTDPVAARNFLKDYYNPNQIWGKTAYTARNLNVADSLNTKDKSLSVYLPIELGQKLFDIYKRNNAIAEDSLKEHIRGIYVAPTFGSGCLINVERTSIYLAYKRYFGKTVAGEDSIRNRYLPIDVTKEIIQVNSYTGNDNDLSNDNDEKMYIKTPTGIFTELTIPIGKIRESIGEQQFSSVKLVLTAEEKPERNYVMDVPGTGKTTPLGDAISKLLLIETADNDSTMNEYNTFFEKKKSIDNVTTYQTVFDSGTNTYTFSNIANMIQRAMDNGKDALMVRLVPIQILSSTQSSYYGTSTTEYAPANYLYPSAVTLKKDNLKIEVVSADLHH
ncbi:MAG: DUF4270 domain-containing protein [Dysgonamonadaceae bacterium]|jgi:hypothetical protein|nr:DUF4270 domain-containing protein [Dysgonamonadaceae bacterium]